jgi:hypothetical protein
MTEDIAMTTRSASVEHPLSGPGHRVAAMTVPGLEA